MRLLRTTFGSEPMVLASVVAHDGNLYGCVPPRIRELRILSAGARVLAPATQHGGGGASTSFELMALSPSVQVSLLKSIFSSVSFSPALA
jgi:hypothetical protein